MFALLSRSRYLNLNYKIKKNFRIRILEKPSRHLSEVECQKMCADLNIILKKCNLENLNYSVFAFPEQFLENGYFTIIYNELSEPIALNIQMSIDCLYRNRMAPVYHIGLALVDPKYQSMGLSWSLYGLTTFLIFLKNKFKPIIISNVTQVPSAFGSVVEAFGDVYPDGKTTEAAPFDYQYLAQQIMEKYRYVFGVGPEAEFDIEKFIIKNSYTGGSDDLKKSFEECPKHRKTHYNDFCQSHLNYQRGDDFLQLGKIDFQTYLKVLLHNKDQSSIKVPLIESLFIVLEGFIAPVIHWFNTHENFYCLRARKNTSNAK